MPTLLKSLARTSMAVCAAAALSLTLVAVVSLMSTHPTPGTTSPRAEQPAAHRQVHASPRHVRIGRRLVERREDDDPDPHKGE